MDIQTNTNTSQVCLCVWNNDDDDDDDINKYKELVDTFAQWAKNTRYLASKLGLAQNNMHFSGRIAAEKKHLQTSQRDSTRMRALYFSLWSDAIGLCVYVCVCLPLDLVLDFGFFRIFPQLDKASSH